MTNEDRDMIKYDLKNSIYYLSYPSPVDSGFWKDGDGIHRDMNEMSVEHLDSCIKKINKDLNYMRIRPEKVSAWLIKMASAKKDELMAALVKKIGKL